MGKIVINIDGINRLNESIKESYKKGKKLFSPELLEGVVAGINKYNKYILTNSKLLVSYEEGYPQIRVIQ